jgi:hypothetical protein
MSDSGFRFPEEKPLSSHKWPLDKPYEPVNLSMKKILMFMKEEQIYLILRQLNLRNC